MQNHISQLDPSQLHAPILHGYGINDLALTPAKALGMTSTPLTN